MLPPGLVPPDALPSDLPPPFHVPFNVDVPSSKSEEPQPMSLSGQIPPRLQHVPRHAACLIYATLMDQLPSHMGSCMH